MLTSFVAAPAASATEADPDYYNNIIEHVLIEGVEAPGLAALLRLEKLEPQFESDLFPAVEAAAASLTEVYRFPDDQRLAELAGTIGDSSYESALRSARSSLQLGKDALDRGHAGLGPQQDGLQRAVGFIDQATGAPVDDVAYADNLRDARARVTSAIALTSEATKGTATASDSLVAAVGAVDAALVAAPGGAEYQDAVADAQYALASASELVYEGLTQLDFLAQELAIGGSKLALATDFVEGADTYASALTQAQTELSAALATSSEAQDTVGSSLFELDAARRGLFEAQAAGMPTTYATTTPEYDARLSAAASSLSAASSEALEIEGNLEAIIQLVRDAIAQLDPGIGVDDPQVDEAIADLKTRLDAVLSALQGLAVSVDDVALELSQAADAIVAISEGDNDIVVSKPTLEAAVASFEIVYNVVLPDGNALLDRTVPATVWTGIGLGQTGLALAADGVEIGVTAVDTYQTEQVERPAWGAAEDAGATDEDGTYSGCRVEKESGVSIFYGDARQNSCRGTGLGDIFWMRGESDLAYGAGGHDQIHAGAGEDQSYGQDGPDHIWGGFNSDGLYGSYGEDILEDNAGTYDPNYFSGGPGIDKADMRDGDTDDVFFSGMGKDPEPQYDVACVRASCSWDYWEQ